MTASRTFDPDDYDAQWSTLGDFVRFNPGARHRRRLVTNAVMRLDRTTISTVLDVGCGLGELYLSLRPVVPAASYTGIDVSSYAIERCRTRFADASWFALDVTTDRLESTFDLVVCSEVTEHLDDPQSALRNIGAMCRPGGVLVLTTPHGRVHATERAVGHVAHPSRTELVAWLEGAGFTIRQLRQWGWPAYLAMKYVGNLAPSTTIDHLSEGTYGTALRRLNTAAYHLTGAGSLPNSRWGPQFVVVAERSP